MRVGIGLSTKKDPAQAAQEAIQQARGSLHQEKIDLAFVFSSVDLSCTTLLKTISNLLAKVPVIGCSSAAIILRQGIFKHCLAIMLLSLPKGVYFHIACVNQIGTKTPSRAGEELAEKLLYGFKDIPRDLSVIFFDGLIKESSKLIYGLQTRLGRSFPLVGASASDNLSFRRTYLYYNQEIFSDAACGILWGGKLKFGLGIRHGWKPLGKPRYVTKCSGNIVYEIDNAPAAGVYGEYLACDLIELRNKLKYISTFYPIGIHIEGKEEYLLRSILSIEDDGSLILQGDVPQGSLVRLMIGTKESCLSATQEAINEAKNGLRGRSSNFVLVFNSITRYMLLGRRANQELEVIKENIDKETPVIGIYTYAEQAPLMAISYQDRTYFHNQTITVLAIAGPD